jgi:predicted enzyme related to lactoylglutathione lyase
MRVTDISWIGILAEDYQVAVRFCSEALGLALESQDEAKVVALFRLPSGQLLEIYGPSNRARKEKYKHYAGPVPGFEVGDVEATRREMIVRGVTFITGVESTPEGDRWSHFQGYAGLLCTAQAVVRQYPGRRGLIAGIARTCIAAQDLEDAAQFYTQVMQMPLAALDRAAGVARFVLDSGHVFEVLDAAGERGRLSPHVIPGFAVPDMAEARRTLAVRGVQFAAGAFEIAPGEVVSYFRGPGDLLFMLCAEASRPE